MTRDLLEELFKNPRPTSRRGVWEMTAEFPDGRVELSRHDTGESGTDQAHRRGLESEAGLQALRLMGFFFDERTGITWRLTQILNSRGIPNRP